MNTYRAGIKTNYIHVTTASVPVVIFANESYKYIDREQGEGRVLRANKLKKNLYVTLIAGDIDKQVRSNIENKKD